MTNRTTVFPDTSIQIADAYTLSLKPRDCASWRSDERSDVHTLPRATPDQINLWVKSG
jgi:hypothetical protein